MATRLDELLANYQHVVGRVQVACTCDRRTASAQEMADIAEARTAILNHVTELEISAALHAAKDAIDRLSPPAPALPPQPMQPIYFAPDGVVRFRANAIVRDLVDAAANGRKMGLNDIASMSSYAIDDREQFWQLIGYSVSGYGDLGFVRRKVAEEADAIARKLLSERALRGDTVAGKKP